MRQKLILLDLDGTLLRSDKTISPRSMRAMNECRQKGAMIGISTARGESNAQPYIAKIHPQVVISSGGALVRHQGQVIYTSMFSAEETRTVIDAAMRLTQNLCQITVDTLTGHYWNYKVNPLDADPNWGEVIHTDYKDFSEAALKISVELVDEAIASKIAASVDDCDLARFSHSNWYKLTKASATKAMAIHRITAALGITTADIIAFGDDFVDAQMLEICGTGVAMGNAIDEVKRIADAVTCSNDEDGVAKYLEEHYIA